jgi:ribosomal-protein-alanine N-acetyltransferase
MQGRLRTSPVLASYSKVSTQPTLRTDRLLLRPFRLSDAADVQRLAGDPAIAATTLNVPHPYRDGMAESWISSHEPAWNARRAVAYAITTPEDEVRGAISLQLLPSQHRGELGYWIGKPFWGAGIATEAARCLVDFAFTQLDVHRVHATHLVRNPPSGRVMQKIGMVQEGVLREHVLKDGKFEDIATYGILRSEWRK